MPAEVDVPGREPVWASIRRQTLAFGVLRDAANRRRAAHVPNRHACRRQILVVVGVIHGCHGQCPFIPGSARHPFGGFIPAAASRRSNLRNGWRAPAVRSRWPRSRPSASRRRRRKIRASFGGDFFCECDRGMRAVVSGLVRLQQDTQCIRLVFLVIQPAVQSFHRRRLDGRLFAEQRQAEQIEPAQPGVQSMALFQRPGHPVHRALGEQAAGI